MENDENLNFVQLIEAHRDVLLKSQVPQIKKKKLQAIAEIIPKWTNISGKTLNEKALFKKLNNMKARAKLAMGVKKDLTAWLKKILEIVGVDENEKLTNDDSASSKADISPSDTESNEREKELMFVKPLCSNEQLDFRSGGERKAEDFINDLETDETKLLSNQQLQRVVLLKQLRVLNLQLNKLEGETRTEHEVLVELIGVDETEIK